MKGDRFFLVNCFLVLAIVIVFLVSIKGAYDDWQYMRIKTSVSSGLRLAGQYRGRVESNIAGHAMNLCSDIREINKDNISVTCHEGVLRIVMSVPGVSEPVKISLVHGMHDRKWRCVSGLSSKYLPQACTKEAV